MGCQLDGADDDQSVSDGSASPSPMPSPPTVDITTTEAAVTPRISRSSSPASGPGLGSRTTPPISFGYPYHQLIQNGFFNDSHPPTAIRG